MKSIVLYDGFCNLCSVAVRFIKKRVRRDEFIYLPFQDESVLNKFPFLKTSQAYDTVGLIENGNYYYKSTAVLRISRRLRRLWPLVYGLIIIPSFIRDFIYCFIARNRYKWFGRKETCDILDRDNF